MTNFPNEEEILPGSRNLVNHGRLLAFEELLEYLNKEYYASATEDPYYGYYVKYIIDVVQSMHDKYATEE